MPSIRRARLRLAIDTWFSGNDAALSRAVGRSTTQINDMLSARKSFGEKVARGIEQSLRGHPAFMLPGWLDTPESAPTRLSEPPPPPFDVNVEPVTGSARAVPIVDWVQAGQLREMVDPYPPGAGDGVEYVDSSYGRCAVALRIKGDSMAPEFREGDVIIVDPEIAPSPGDFVVVRNGSHEATFKKFRPRGIDASGREVFELVPLNDDYPTMRSDTEPLLIVGTMVEHRKRRRR
jgi:SOS-response transcriptional repressor LexA